MLPASPAPQSDEPLYLSFIDLFARVAACYFAIVGVAVVIDLVRGDGLTFRSWTSFAIQSVAAFLLAAFVARWTLAKWQRTAHQFVPGRCRGERTGQQRAERGSRRHDLAQDGRTRH